MWDEVLKDHQKEYDILVSAANVNSENKQLLRYSESQDLCKFMEKISDYSPSPDLKSINNCNTFMLNLIAIPSIEDTQILIDQLEHTLHHAKMSLESLHHDNKAINRGIVDARLKDRGAFTVEPVDILNLLAGSK